MKTDSVRTIPAAAGVLLAAAAIWELVTLFFGFSLVRFLELTALFGLSVLALQLRRDRYLLIPVGVLAALSLVGLHPLQLPHTVGCLLLLAASLLAVTDYFPRFAGVARRFWFVPPVMFAVGLLCSLLTEPFFVSGRSIFLAAGYLLLTLWIIYPKGMPLPAVPARCSKGLLAHGLLFLFTLGVYPCMWIYRVTAYLNRMENERPRVPAYKLLLCMLIPFYYLYWVYDTARRLDKQAAAFGLASDIAVPCTVLTLVAGIATPLLLQDRLNLVAALERGQAPAPAAGTKGSHRAQEKLAGYRKLLDNGIISQPEYEKQKKRLGL